jgi:transposase
VDEAAICLMAEKLDIYLVYLPPYSPDLNPIEFISEKYKAGCIDQFRGKRGNSKRNNRESIL